MQTSKYNAKRFEQKPLRQPSYNFRDVPKCEKDLKGSTLQRVETREHFVENMAEIVLLCNEAMRRSKAKRKGTNSKPSSKPLSLEYIADRIDVDDPIFGYFVRHEDRLQGLITATTFTNWQKTFRWDSMHESAYSYDDDETAKNMKNGTRKYDKEGTLAEELQSTIRCGDIYDEGIVWPRIAEISLLGGLGCGKALLSLVIEELECMKPSGSENYDYVVLQATDNSIPFYESMGFTRVGAITEDDQFDIDKKGKTSKESDNSDDASLSEQGEGREEGDKSESANSLEEQVKSEIVSSAITTYKTKKAGETPSYIAKKLGIDVWDIIFLNRFVHIGIAPGSRLVVKTILSVPCNETARVQATSHVIRREKMDVKLQPEAPLWYIAKENDTPRMIATKFRISCADVLRGNTERLPDLLSGSRLRAGTRIKVSHFDVPDDKHVPYCHWTFPDDSFEQGEPSYMMARKLNRRTGKGLPVCEYAASLAVQVSPYQPTKLFLPESPMEPKPESTVETVSTIKPPNKPFSAFQMFSKKQREFFEKEGTNNDQLSKALKILWEELPSNEKSLYKNAAKVAKAEYKSQLSRFNKAKLNPGDLFNNVVRLKAEAPTDNSEFKYWFVLTYIPDLKWCHLAPMRRVGTFDLDHPESPGRPKWKLVDAKQEKEIDISSKLVIPVESLTMTESDDADEEEWDILEVASPPPKIPRQKLSKKNGKINDTPSKLLAVCNGNGTTGPSTLKVTITMNNAVVSPIKPPKSMKGKDSTKSSRKRQKNSKGSASVTPSAQKEVEGPQGNATSALPNLPTVGYSNVNFIPSSGPWYSGPWQQPHALWGAQPFANYSETPNLAPISHHPNQYATQNTPHFPPFYPQYQTNDYRYNNCNYGYSGQAQYKSYPPTQMSHVHNFHQAGNMPLNESVQLPQQQKRRVVKRKQSPKKPKISSSEKLTNVKVKVQPVIFEEQASIGSGNDSTTITDASIEKIDVEATAVVSDKESKLAVEVEPIVLEQHTSICSASDSSTITDNDGLNGPVISSVVDTNSSPLEKQEIEGKNLCTLSCVSSEAESTPTLVEQAERISPTQSSFTEKLKRKMAPIFSDETFSRKARKVNSAGACRSVLQN